MIFEFVVSCQMTPGTDIRQVVTELLAEVLADTQNDFGDSEIASMIREHSQRLGEDVIDEQFALHQHTLYAFALDLPDQTESIRAIVDGFTKSLPDIPPGFHTVKFEDPLLQDELARYASKIFVLEMKLRRVLSLIYLDTYQGESPFDLLRDETVQIALPPRD